MGKEWRGGGDRQTDTPSSHPLPSPAPGQPRVPTDLVSIVQTSQDGSHWWKGGKLPQASFLGCDLLRLLSQAGGREGKAEERQVNSQQAKERGVFLCALSHILSPSRKNGTSELEELKVVPPDYIQTSIFWASPSPSSLGPASGTKRVGGCRQTGVSNGSSKGAYHNA